MVAEAAVVSSKDESNNFSCQEKIFSVKIEALRLFSGSGGGGGGGSSGSGEEELIFI